MNTFTLSNIPVPTSHRSIFRSTIRSAKGFDDWCRSKGIETSRNMLRAQYDECADALGIGQIILDILGLPAPETQTQTETGTETIETQTAETDIFETAEKKVTFSIDPVLAPLAPFVSDKILDQIKTAMGPIVAAANKPPVEVTKEIVREVRALAPLAAGANPYAKRVRQEPMHRAFGYRGGVSVPVTFWDAVDAPPVDRFYVLDKSLFQRVMTTIEHGKPVWLAGPAGSGKTSLPMHIAAVLRRPFVRLAFTRQTEIIDLIGSETFKEGVGMVWQDRVLTQAIRRPGTIVLLDEITIAPPGVLALFQTLLDHGFLTLPTGEVVHCADGVTFVAADNTNGTGDASGRYAATNEMNAALMDRFEKVVTMDYPSVELETSALFNRTGAPLQACQYLVEFIHKVRGAPGFEGVPLSLRRMVAFMRACLDGFSTDIARDDTILSRLNEAEHVALFAKWKADFETSRFAALLAEKPFVEPSMAPQQVEARTGFDIVE